VVSIEKCNACHVTLSLHGANRNDNIEHCVLCHNPSTTDSGYRASAQNPADKAAPAESVNMPWMIHRIHMGEQLAEQGAGYTVVGYGGSHNDFSEVRYPAFSKSGSPGYVQACDMCHVNGSESVLPTGKNQVNAPTSKLSPAGAVTSACTSCHNADAAFAHSLSNTDQRFGESCTVCHGGTADFNATKVHAAK
jgi:OmcA/MtrC family decaheme c-type cytochrome